MIEKPTIIITSLGRTGTLFFQNLFKHIYPDGVSLHEPDYFNFGQYRGARERIKQVCRQIHEAGFSNIVLKKITGKWSLIKLSDGRIRGKLDRTSTVRDFLRQRQDFIQSQRGLIYIESSSAYYGIIDIVNSAFAQHTLSYIIRDGRDWVRSIINWGESYTQGYIKKLIFRTWPEAPEFMNDPYCEEWAYMDHFQKVCWSWNKLNGYALATINDNPNARLFRFEDLFASSERNQHLYDFIAFTTRIHETQAPDIRSIDEWLDIKIHKSIGDYPTWEYWSDYNKQQFTRICGKLMEEQGYSLDAYP